LVQLTKSSLFKFCTNFLLLFNYLVKTKGQKGKEEGMKKQQLEAKGKMIKAKK